MFRTTRHFGVLKFNPFSNNFYVFFHKNLVYRNFDLYHRGEPICLMDIFEVEYQEVC